MIFARMALVVAIGALILGGWQIAAGIMIAQEVFSPEQMIRYHLIQPSGALIDKGVYMIAFGIAMGALWEIRKRL
jgi:hypothetical protein